MGLLVLIAAGAVLGWLAAIVSRIEESREILLNLAAGVVGAVLAGALANTASLLGSLRSEALLAGLVGSVAALVLLGAARHVGAR